MIYDYLIVGAGLSGLTLGIELQKKNKRLVIIEKSKGVGGRIATRRINEQGVDHGAPYLKSHPIIYELLHQLNVIGGKIADPGIYLEGGMTALPKKMAQNLPIIKDEKIVHIEFTDKIWNCRSEKGNHYQAKTLVLTAPLPQALELLTNSKIDFNEDLKTISYTKGLLGIFTANENVLIKTSLPENVHSVLSMKSRQLNPSAWVLRTTEEFSETNFERSDEENLSQIVTMFSESFEEGPVISHSELKKWRYVLPKTVLPSPYLKVQDELYLIGDGFLYPDVRGALLSAKGLAENLD